MTPRGGTDRGENRLGRFSPPPLVAAQVVVALLVVMGIGGALTTPRAGWLFGGVIAIGTIYWLLRPRIDVFPDRVVIGPWPQKVPLSEIEHIEIVQRGLSRRMTFWRRDGVPVLVPQAPALLVRWQEDAVSLVQRTIWEAESRRVPVRRTGRSFNDRSPRDR